MSKLLRTLLVAFVVVDVALVVGVVMYVNRTPPPADLPAAAAAATSAEPAVDNKAQDRFRFRPATAVSISLANDSTLLYATRGQCDGDAAPKLVVSTDGGGSTSTSDTGLAEILAVSAESREQLRIVGADGDCVVTRLMSTDGGDTWAADPEDDLWHPDLEDPKSVVSPNGSSKTGCTVTSLSQVGQDFGRVSCSNGHIRGTGDGDKWVRLGRLDNVRAASFTSFNAGVALAVYQGCAANAFSTRDSGRTWTPGGCISGEPAQGITAADSGWAAVVDAQLYVSEDDGESWSQP